MRFTGFPDNVRRLIMDRADGHCECCGLAAPMFHLHHRRPRGMGSTRRPETNTASAGLLLCPPCHEAIESHREEALRRGHLVRQGHNPLTTPVLRRRDWVLLTDEGEVI